MGSTFSPNKQTIEQCREVLAGVEPDLSSVIRHVVDRLHQHIFHVRQEQIWGTDRKRNPIYMKPITAQRKKGWDAQVRYFLDHVQRDDDEREAVISADVDLTAASDPGKLWRLPALCQEFALVAATLVGAKTGLTTYAVLRALPKSLPGTPPASTKAKGKRINWQHAFCAVEVESDKFRFFDASIYRTLESSLSRGLVAEQLVNPYDIDIKADAVQKHWLQNGRTISQAEIGGKRAAWLLEISFS